MLLVDANLSPRLVSLLRQAGHYVIHVFDLGMGEADDETILARALVEERAVVTADTDFVTGLLEGVDPVRAALDAGSRESCHDSADASGWAHSSVVSGFDQGGDCLRSFQVPTSWTTRWSSNDREAPAGASRARSQP